MPCSLNPRRSPGEPFAIAAERVGRFAPRRNRQSARACTPAHAVRTVSNLVPLHSLREFDELVAEDHLLTQLYVLTVR
jgi:hypothetical protein